MSLYNGRLQAEGLQPTAVTIEIEDDRFRISSGRAKLGSWPLDKIHAERVSIYRFDLVIDDDRFEFLPEDPSAFSDAVGAVVDLTVTNGRFGLKARIERAANA